MKKGQIVNVELLYRVVVCDKDDLELTRGEAVYLRDALTALLSTRTAKTPKRMPTRPGKR